MENKKDACLSILDSVKSDGFLISHLVNIRYLTGFRGTFGYFLLTKKGHYLFTDSRYIEYARRIMSGVHVVLLKNGLVRDLKDVFSKIKIRTLAYEYGNVSYHFYSKVVRLVNPGKLVPARETVEKMRMVKTHGEVQKIKRACHIIVSSIENIRRDRKKYRGYTEKALADEIESAVRKKGAISTSFPTIVAEGKNSSMPHYHSSPKKKIFFRPLLIDAGAVVDDYNSDLTRTLSDHKISKKFREIQQVVHEAQKRALSKIRPGIPAKDVDRAARDFIEKAGYGEYFGHGLGHGIGLEVHEGPLISKRSRAILREGMVFTVEPGIYMPDQFGCRIEDVVVVTGKGYRILTR
ncbi:MAG: aminopeptidase P family protein [Candidatus Aureabacteria bacterium]|nr:aminopeptidase P family protein [Candidatus Auribacterota bacterium]